MNNPDFEYIACLHCNTFKGKNYKSYIDKSLNFRDLQNFKSSRTIYSLLNLNENSKEIMLSKLNKRKYIANIYNVNTRKKTISIKKTIITEDNQCINGSNINEFFDILSKIEI